MLVLVQENIQWLGIANKYLENQWKSVKDWGNYKLERKFSDELFEKEFDFICNELKHGLNIGTM